MIKAILLDDESHIIKELRDLILKHFADTINIVAEAKSVKEGIIVVEEFHPDLLFLDINFLDGTGFDLIAKTTYKDFNVIFITGYDEFAIKAIKAGALDYIVKPIEEDEFKEAVFKAVEGYKKNISYKSHLEISKEYFKGKSKKRVILSASESIYAINEDDILYCQSDGNYTTFYTLTTGKIVVSKNIKKIEELLSEASFIRCHRSFIINREHIIKYNKQGTFTLSQNIEIPVSRMLKDHALKKAFE